jgi:hypothetical protein
MPTQTKVVRVDAGLYTQLEPVARAARRTRPEYVNHLIEKDLKGNPMPANNDPSRRPPPQHGTPVSGSFTARNPPPSLGDKHETPHVPPGKDAPQIEEGVGKKARL